jgi:hypothetical protein
VPSPERIAIPVTGHIWVINMSVSKSESRLYCLGFGPLVYKRLVISFSFLLSWICTRAGFLPLVRRNFCLFSRPALLGKVPIFVNTVQLICLLLHLIEFFVYILSWP